MIKEKYGFRIGEKVLFTYNDKSTKVLIIKSFDPKPFCKSVRFTSGLWDEIHRISCLQPCEGRQLLFEFMRKV
jgi:hypothetical protein